MSERFGDAEPEDAWQIDDPIPVLLDNIHRRVILIVRHLALLTRRLEDDG